MTPQLFSLNVRLFTFTFCVALQESSPTSNVKPPETSDILVAGAGLAGLLQVHQFFKHSIDRNMKLPKIHLIEGRPLFTRPQVIKLSTEVARNLPQSVINALWPDEPSRNLIFRTHFDSDFEFSVKPHPMYMPHVQILNLQQLLFNYLKFTYGVNGTVENIRGFFTFEFNKKLSFKGDDFKKFIDDSGYKAIILAIGNTDYYQELRNSLVLDGCRYVQPNSRDTLGISAIFKNSCIDVFIRKGNFQSEMEYTSCGIYYAPANDDERNAQVYIYPGKNLAFDKFFDMGGSAEFVQNETFGNSKAGNPANQCQTLREFIAKLKHRFLKVITKLGIPIKDSNNIRFYSASRQEYYHEQAAVVCDGVPVLIIGDSLGSTDYKKGQNVGRAYYEGEYIVNKMDQNGSFGDVAIVKRYNAYWNDVVRKEINSSNLSRSSRPEDENSSKGCSVLHVLGHAITAGRKLGHTNKSFGKSEKVA